MTHTVRTRGYPLPHPQVQDLLAYLRLALNPADDGAFLRVYNTPPRRLGDAKAAFITRLTELQVGIYVCVRGRAGPVVCVCVCVYECVFGSVGATRKGGMCVSVFAWLLESTSTGDVCVRVWPCVGCGLGR